MLPEVDSEGVRVPPFLPGMVEIADAVMPLTDDVVVRDLGRISTGREEVQQPYHDACDRAQEYRIRRKIRREVVTTLEQVPRQHA